MERISPAIPVQGLAIIIHTTKALRVSACLKTYNCLRQHRQIWLRWQRDRRYLVVFDYGQLAFPSLDLHVRQRLLAYALPSRLGKANKSLQMMILHPPYLAGMPTKFT